MPDLILPGNTAIKSRPKVLALPEWWRPDGSNPCRHVTKFKEKKRKRYLSQQELARLGEALAKAEDGELDRPISGYAVATIRLLILTGARRGEILTLRWDEVNFERGCLELSDSKTGEKEVFLPPAAAHTKGAAFATLQKDKADKRYGQDQVNDKYDFGHGIFRVVFCFLGQERLFRA